MNAVNHNTESKACCCHAQKQKPTEPVVKAKKTAKALPSVLLSVLIAFFPKCPVCWAVYMSMFGSLGLARLPYAGWLLPVLFSFLGFHLFMLYKKGAKNGYLPFIVSVVGATIIICGRTAFPYEKWLPLTGMAFIISGSLLNSLSNVSLKLNAKIKNPITN